MVDGAQVPAVSPERRDEPLVCLCMGRRYYLHRFITVDADWRIDRVSPPFFFRHRGIEFAAGACLTHDGSDVLITFGVEDCEAWLCRISLRRVLELLRVL